MNRYCAPDLAPCSTFQTMYQRHVPARQVRATFAWCTRATWRTSYANFARNICVTYAPDSRRMGVTSANPTQMLCALPHEERATRDVTFGPLCISEKPNAAFSGTRIRSDLPVDLVRSCSGSCTFSGHGQDSDRIHVSLNATLAADIKSIVRSFQIFHFEFFAFQQKWHQR
jgi:hypothetical protein